MLYCVWRWQRFARPIPTNCVDLSYLVMHSYKFHCMSVQYDKHIFIITNTIHTIGVDKITLFKPTFNNVLSPTCFDRHWIIIREVYTLFAKLLRRFGDRGSTVVKVLCYKSEGRWFDPSWCPSDRTVALGSTQPLTEMSTRSISWG